MLWLILILLSPLIYLLLDWLLRSLRVSDYENKFVLITGCDSGFGKALAMRLDVMGFFVLAGCLTKDGISFLSENASDKMRPFLLDVSSTDSIEEALHFVKEILPEKQSLWALVNNAGIAGQGGPPDILTVQDFKTILNVNLYGPMEMCRLFIPLIRQSKGRIVNITSVAGRLSGAAGPYGASKFGLEGYTDILRHETYWQGIKVCILEPAFFKTNILNPVNLNKGISERFNNAGDNVRAAYGDQFDKKFMRGTKTVIKLAETNLNPVIDAYVHAITSRFPRTRYVLGLQAKFVYIPATYLPDWILNIAVSLTMKRAFSAKH